jgi:hypothetical protein
VKVFTWLRYRRQPATLPVSQAQTVLRDLRQLVLSSEGDASRRLSLLPILREFRKATDNMIEYCEAGQLNEEIRRRETIIRRDCLTRFLDEQRKDKEGNHVS